MSGFEIKKLIHLCNTIDSFRTVKLRNHYSSNLFVPYKYGTLFNENSNRSEIQPPIGILFIVWFDEL